MAASITDHFKKGYGFFSTTLASQKNSGASSMSLSDATGVPTTTGLVFTVGRVNSSGTSTPSTRAIYKGTLSGTTVSNLTLTEGTDQTHAAGTVVEITFTATHWNDAVDGIVAEHNQDGTHAAVTATTVTTTGKITAGSSLEMTAGTLTLPSASINQSALPLGAVVQMVYNVDGAVATGTGTIPEDDTIPQNTEGTQFMSQAITPKSATNILIIEIVAYFANSAINDFFGALFQDSTANAIAATTGAKVPAANNRVPITLRHIMVAGTTSATTFKLRAGGVNPSTTTFNGAGSAREFGAIPKSSMTITEYKA